MINRMILVVCCLAVTGAWAQTDAAKDLCSGNIEPFDTITMRLMFLKAVGTDVELSAEEFAADRKAGGSFAAEFDKWEAAAAFDKNANKTLDWFEFEAYRQDIRDRVMAAFDANGDGKLTGKERDAANAALAKGDIPAKKPAGGGIAPPVVPPGGAVTPRVPATTPAAPGPEPKPEALKKYLDLTRDFEAFHKKFDADGDGKLSSEETIKAVKAYSQETQKLYQEAFDTDGDGKVSQAESLKAASVMMAEANKQTLARFDTNKDGKIDDAENQAMMETYLHDMDKRMMASRLKDYDANGNGKWDADEETKYFMDQDGQRKRMFQAARDRIKPFDKDGDGKLSPDEAREMNIDARAEAAVLWAQQKNRIKEWDSDGDGKLSDAEKAAAKTKIAATLKDRSDRQRKQALEQFDADKDGKLSQAERAKQGEAQIKLARDRYDAMIKDGDEDGDGKLSVEEYRHQAAAQHKQRLQKYDTDRDGELSPLEQDAMMEAEGMTVWY